MHGRIGKWGNNLALRIPSSAAHEASVSEGYAVDIKAEKGRIVITPVGKPHRYSLAISTRRISGVVLTDHLKTSLGKAGMPASQAAVPDRDQSSFAPRADLGDHALIATNREGEPSRRAHRMAPSRTAGGMCG
jgi:antitoxin component of MazEF toxin-antitoxin module